MSHCRWVVLAEDCYQQLSKAVPKETEEETHVQAVQEAAPVDKSNEPPAQEHPLPKTKYQEETLPEPHKDLDKPQTSSKVENKKEEPDWTASLPPSFRKEGEQLYQKLIELPGFTISSVGIVEIDRIPLEDYSITDFLRTACIPFNKAVIPMRLQEWLRTNGLTSFRNHLLKILPKWENRYSWRKSTMAGRKEPSGVPKPSTQKRRN